jgi:hypothetical protein
MRDLCSFIPEFYRLGCSSADSLPAVPCFHFLFRQIKL